MHRREAEPARREDTARASVTRASRCWPIHERLGASRARAPGGGGRSRNAEELVLRAAGETSCFARSGNDPLPPKPARMCGGVHEYSAIVPVSRFVVRVASFRAEQVHGRLGVAPGLDGARRGARHSRRAAGCQYCAARPRLRGVVRSVTHALGARVPRRTCDNFPYPSSSREHVQRDACHADLRQRPAFTNGTAIQAQASAGWGLVPERAKQGCFARSLQGWIHGVPERGPAPRRLRPRRDHRS